ncbi:MAG: serine/threonine protein kinase [Pirellulaceae bacterium]
MALSKADFWKLVADSRLLSDKQRQRLEDQFSKLPGAAQDSAKPLATWLVRQNLLSKYQATILLAGRTGPFLYGDYKVYDRVEAGGGLAGLFRALHMPTNHPVLLRFLTGSTASDPAVWAAVSTWAGVPPHEQVQRVYEARQVAKYRFLVLEDLRGQSLAEYLAQSAPLPPGEAARWGRLCALGLAHLHGQGRGLGDFRPAQVWLEEAGGLKLLVGDAAVRVQLPAIPGDDEDGIARADYAAPEFLQPGRLADPLTEIYALGCMLYHMVAGQPPFPGGDVRSKLQRHAQESIAPVVQRGVPPEFQKLIAFAMAKNPAVRLQSAQLVAEQLLPFCDPAEPAQRAVPPSATLEPYEGWLRTQQTAEAGAAALHAIPAAAMAPLSVPALPPRPATPPPAAPPAMPATAGQLASGTVMAAPAGLPEIRIASAAAPAEPVSPTTPPTLRLSAATEPAGPARRSLTAAELIRRRNRARRRNNLIVLAVSVLALAGVVIAGVMALNRVETPPGTAAGPGTTGVPNSSAPATPPLAVDKAGLATDQDRGTADLEGIDVVEDDGQLLWAPPTTGPAIDLRFVPPGAQLYLVVRPADLINAPEGERVLRALGPDFAATRTAWESQTGLPFGEIEQLVVALYGNNGQFPKTAFVAHTLQDRDSAALLARWGNPAPVADTPAFYQREGRAFYLPAEEPRTFVVGPFEPEMKEAASNGWKAPLMRRELGRLLQESNSQNHVTLLFAPNFLFGDGVPLLDGANSLLRSSLEWMLGDGLKAGMLQAHFGSEGMYAELRMEGDIQTDRIQLASRFQERLAEVPDKIELHIAHLNPPPYWRLVANRYPAMVRFLYQHVRVGVEGPHAAVNVVLPPAAAHNLVFGGEMLFSSTPTQVSEGTVASAQPAGPANVQEALQTKISLAFAEDSLEFAIQNVANEVKSSFPAMPFDFKIKILGPDLEKDGITRNQQVRDFDQQHKTVAEILTVMVRKANPITTVKDPSELDQKLIWVVGPDPEQASSQIVLITTRAGAEQKNFTLPDVFRPK